MVCRVWFAIASYDEQYARRTHPNLRSPGSLGGIVSLREMNRASGLMACMLAMTVATAPCVARAQLTAPRATLTQLYRIDGEEHDLTRIGMILPFADGRMAITQPRDSRILIY